jgi:hypothetical protein
MKDSGWGMVFAQGFREQFCLIRAVVLAAG